MNWDRSVLESYFWLSYLVVVGISSSFLRYISDSSAKVWLFALAVLFGYSFAFILPLKLLAQGLERLVCSPRLPLSERMRHRLLIVVCGLAVLLCGSLDMLLLTDVVVYGMYGFHFNSFVLNIIFTKGGIESMGGDASTTLTFLALWLGFVLLHTALLVLLVRLLRMRDLFRHIFSPWRSKLAFVFIVLLLLSQGFAYGISNFKGYVQILEAAEAFPLYVPVTFASAARKLGINPSTRQRIRMRGEVAHLNYPLKPLVRRPDHKNYNIVWLTAESWRFDMFDPNITPRTWAFAQKAARFQQHFSAGNGTRMAMFGMFYGLYGNYWFEFLQQRRGPVFFDVLLESNYQMEMFTSARFTYPEFDKTIFAAIDQKHLHDDNEGSQTWQIDRRNVTRMLDFIENRDPNRPFMTFMFFESPHARYQFPDECIIARPYLENFNYITADMKEDIGLIKNRYINSCNHLDQQFGRIIDYLTEKGLLDSTIVIMTGDHGEEFMETGRWGHNSNFSDWQTLVPMIIRAPGVEPVTVTRMTSHLDLPATILGLLGVTNDPADYSLGFDMLGGRQRQYTVMGEWDKIVCVDSEYKATFPMRSALGTQELLTRDDKDAKQEEDAYYQSRQQMLLQVMREMKIFGG